MVEETTFERWLLQWIRRIGRLFGISAERGQRRHTRDLFDHGPSKPADVHKYRLVQFDK